MLNTEHLQKYLQYLARLGAVAIDQFDDDWEPIGPRVRADLRWAGLAREEHGHILRTLEGCNATATED